MTACLNCITAKSGRKIIAVMDARGQHRGFDPSFDFDRKRPKKRDFVETGYRAQGDHFWPVHRDFVVTNPRSGIFIFNHSTCRIIGFVKEKSIRQNAKVPLIANASGKRRNRFLELLCSAFERVEIKDSDRDVWHWT